MISEYEILRPIADIHEEHCPALLWPYDGGEPTVGSCLDDDFDEEEWEYYSLIPKVKTPEEVKRLAGEKAPSEYWAKDCGNIRP